MAKRKSLTAKPKKPIVYKLRSLAIVCLLVYAVVVLISQQVAIADKKKEIEKVQSQLNAAQQSNDEYSRLLSMSDNKEFMEKIAIERLGYAYPNERRIFDASRN